MLRTRDPGDGKLRGRSSVGPSNRSTRHCSIPTEPLLANTESDRLVGIEAPRQSQKVSARPQTLAQVRRLLQGRTREERREKRQQNLPAPHLAARFPGQSLLEQRAVSLAVSRDYAQRYREFQHHCKAHQLSLNGATRLDDACCSFLNAMFVDGHDVSEGSKSFAAIMDANPHCSGKNGMLRSRRCLQGWTKLDPGRTRPPLPWGLLALVGTRWLEQGHVRAALALAVMFTCYLRPGEALNLREEDLVRPYGGLKTHSLNLHPQDRQEESKVGVHDETLLLDSSVVPGLGAMLTKLLTGAPHSSLFQLQAEDLRNLWQNALTSLGLGPQYAVLYQIRHSGPSHDRLYNLRDLASVKRRGRWAADSSVKRYEAAAKLSQEFHRLPAHIQQAALVAEKQFPLALQKSSLQLSRKRKHLG